MLTPKVTSALQRIMDRLVMVAQEYDLKLNVNSQK